MPKGPWSVRCAQPVSREHQKTLLFLQLLPPLPTGLLAQGGRGCASQCARDEATGKRRRKAEKTIWLSAFTTREPLRAISLLGTDPGLPVKTGGMWSYEEVLGPSKKERKRLLRSRNLLYFPSVLSYLLRWTVASSQATPGVSLASRVPRPMPQLWGMVKGNWSCSPTSAKRPLVTFSLRLFFPGLAISNEGDSAVCW